MDLQNAFEKMHSAIKGNDLYAKVTCLGLILVSIFSMVEIHFLIYLGHMAGKMVTGRGRGY